MPNAYKSFDFNPRSPHGERRFAHVVNSDNEDLDFNPRSPHGERRDVLATYWETLKISIHAPRTGSDSIRRRDTLSRQFQSTLPARGATKSDWEDLLKRWISIHAPRTGSDSVVGVSLYPC